MVSTLKLLLFGILGGLVGYFVFPYITPIYNFARQPSDEWWVRSFSTLLGVGLFLVWGSGKFPRGALVGGTVGFLVGGLLSIPIASLFVDLVWYQLTDFPKDSSLMTNIVQASTWGTVTFTGYKLTASMSNASARA